MSIFSNSKSITAADLRCHHLNKHSYVTDMEYTVVARTLQKIISSNVTGQFFTSAVIKDIALRLTLHLEDVVADAGVWRSFCTEHHKLYGRWLPFEWNKKRMPLDEVIPESCAFIIWMTLVSFEETRYINPLVPAIEALADVVYEYLNIMFEEVSINEEMLEDFYSDERLSNFYRMRDVLSWLADAEGCYLSNWDVTLDSAKQERDSFKKYVSEEKHLVYQVRSVFPLKNKVGPLALMPQEWYAAMLTTHKERNRKAYAKKVNAIKAKRFDTYLIESSDNGVFVVRGVDGERFQVEQSSFGLGFDNWNPEQNLAITSFAYYDGKWNVNGIAVFQHFDGDFDKVVKEHLDSVDDHKRAKVAFEDVVTRNGGRRLYYYRDIKEMSQWFDSEIPNRGMQKFFDNFPAYMRGGNNMLAYLPSDGDPEFSLDACNCICDSNNPFYDAEESRRDSFDIMDETQSIHGECIQYMIKHGMLCNLTFAGGDAKASHALMQENIDFVARFYRRGVY